MASRRALLRAGAAAFLAPRFALAQTARKAVVVLFAGEEEDDGPASLPYFEEMRRAGWVEGTNVDYERVYGRGTREYMEGLARSAAGRAPDLIYATTAALAIAVSKETDSIPMVFTVASDPVASGLAASMERPGRNATGVFQPAGDGVPRRLEIAQQAMPGLKRIGVLIDRRSTEYQRQRTLHEDAARPLGLSIATAEFTNFEAVAKLLANFRRDGTSTAVLTPSVTLFGRRREVAETALRNRIALVGHRLEWAEAGAFVSYGPDVVDSLRRSARISARLLKGAAAAETPVEVARRLELVINQRSARTLGLALPQELVKRADRVID